MSNSIALWPLKLTAGTWRSVTPGKSHKYIEPASATSSTESLFPIDKMASLPRSVHGSARTSPPNTIRDAVRVTSGPSERHLWVDPLVQDNPAELAPHIANTHPVYYGSGNADANLPGLDPESRDSSDISERIHGLSVMHLQWQDELGEG